MFELAGERVTFEKTISGMDCAATSEWKATSSSVRSLRRTWVSVGCDGARRNRSGKRTMVAAAAAKPQVRAALMKRTVQGQHTKSAAKEETRVVSEETIVGHAAERVMGKEWRRQRGSGTSAGSTRWRENLGSSGLRLVPRTDARTNVKLLFCSTGEALHFYCCRLRATRPEQRHSGSWPSASQARISLGQPCSFASRVVSVSSDSCLTVP